MGRALVILMLYEMVKKHEIDLSHKLSLADGPKAYDIFDKKEDGNIKVILKTYGESNEYLQTSWILDQIRSFIAGLHYCFGASFADLLADYRKRPERQHVHQSDCSAVLYFVAGVLERLPYRKKNLRDQNRKKTDHRSAC